MTHTILILPGLYNSGEGHWQSLWEAELPNATRVKQRDWNAPCRNEWVSTLDAAICAANDNVIIAAHSLGCALAIWWSQEKRNMPYAAKVKGALLVAPPDVERSGFPTSVTGFAPMPTHALPFKSIVAASSDDPWCSISRARNWARAWESEFHAMGRRGHLNAESGLAEWPQGQQWLASLAGP